MNKMVMVLILALMLTTAGCGSKKEEEVLAQVTEVVSEPGGIAFTLDGYWKVNEEETKSGDGRRVDLEAYHTKTGTDISIIYEDLTETKGGTLVRTRDYVNAVRENMLLASDYTYECSEVTDAVVHGKEYLKFSAMAEETDGILHFYIRRIEDKMMILMITLYGEDTLQDILEKSEGIS